MQSRAVRFASHRDAKLERIKVQALGTVPPLVLASFEVPGVFERGLRLSHADTPGK